MSETLRHMLSIDAPAMLTGMLAAMLCGLLGNFLLLRRQSLMGDAIAHSVLPGLVVGFLISGTRATMPMLIGAGIAGAIAAVLSDVVKRVTRLESGAVMGVIFSTMFAIGVVLIERVGRDVDLDPDCVLSGQLERVFWFAPRSWAELASWGTLTQLPRELVTLAIAMLLASSLVLAFFKELKIVSFDPALARALGIPAGTISLGLMLAVAAAVVVSFEAVGSILVVGMLICPPATARLLTDRLATQIWLSVLTAAVAGLIGYLLAAHAPRLVPGLPTLSAAGMISVVSGVLLVVGMLLAPRHGVIARRVRQRRLAATIAREDLLADLLRAEERGRGASPSGHISRDALRSALQRGEVREENGHIVLTDLGRRQAINILRSHRLWESWLVDHAGLRPDHVHDRATDLEHMTDDRLREQLGPGGRSDPHGRPIPPPSFSEPPR